MMHQCQRARPGAFRSVTSDASLVGSNFGVNAPPAPGAADLNIDKVVNIRDLVLVGGNYGKTGPITMP